MEDLETPRTKAWAAAQVLEDLHWLGIDFDGPVIGQSQRAAAHETALIALIEGGFLLPCVCSRRDVERAQSAPHVEDELQYPGTCRGRFSSVVAAFAAGERPVALRFRVEPGAITFEDAYLGPKRRDPSVEGGDFVVARWDPDHGYSIGYQLAVVVDDAAMGVDVVIRGDDLLSSTPRQILLQRALGLPTPAYAHLPLVVGPDGRRLAKRHGDTRVSAYRAAGVSPAAIKAWIARVSGIPLAYFEAPLGCGFDWNMVPPERVIVMPHRVADGPPEETARVQS